MRFIRDCHSGVQAPDNILNSATSGKATSFLPGQMNWDMSIVKSFGARFLTAFNHPQQITTTLLSPHDSTPAQVRSVDGKMTVRYISPQLPFWWNKGRTEDGPAPSWVSRSREHCWLWCPWRYVRNDTIGIDERTKNNNLGWFDSDQEHVIERITRPFLNYLIYQVTIASVCLPALARFLVA